MPDRGYIKLYRAIRDNEFWPTDRPYTRPEAWIDMLMMANYKESSFRKRGTRVELKRGQIGRSIKGLADRWRWSQGKVDRFLADLKDAEQIEYQKNNITTVITIINYNEYQGDGDQNGEQTETRRGANGDQTETKRGHINKDKKLKKVNKEKKEYISPRLGEHSNVRLTKDELDKLVQRFGKEKTLDLIERLSGYIASKGDKYKSHYATILQWVKRDGNGPSKGMTAEQEQKRADLKRELRIAEDSLERAEEANKFTPSEDNRKRLNHWTREVNRIRKELEG